MKQKLFEMVEIAVPIFFYFYEILKIKDVGPNNIYFLHYLKYCLIFSDFIKIKQIWTWDLDHFPKILTPSPRMECKIILWIMVL